MQRDETFWKQVIEEALTNKAEYNFLDFKLNLSDKNERLKEHINAFGNLERGGCLVFGIKNFVPVEINNWDDIIQKITHLAETTQEPNLSVNAFPLNMGNDHKLLCLHILPGSSKPVFIKDRPPLGGNACFKRSGASTIAMSIQEIKDILVNAQENYYDEAIVKEAKPDDLDFDLLTRFLPKLNQHDQWNSKNLAMLKDYRILDGMQNSHAVTVAGWLCFAKSPQEIRQFRNAYIEFQIFQGIIRDMPIKKYEIKGNLSNQIEQAIQLLKQNMWLIPKIQGIRREDIPAYPDVMLREAITNSVVHRDYKKMHQPIKIAMFSNRIEIENPGGLMPGLTVFNLIHRRDWRNPLLAELMKKFGFGEMDGQGIDRLYAETISIKVPPPIFIDNQTSFKVILSAPKTYTEFTPEEKRLMIIILAIVQNAVDNESVRNCLGISSEKASTLIKTMVADKILQVKNESRKYAKYVLTPQYHEKIYG